MGQWGSCLGQQGRQGVTSHGSSHHPHWRRRAGWGSRGQSCPCALCCWGSSEAELRTWSGVSPVRVTRVRDSLMTVEWLCSDKAMETSLASQPTGGQGPGQRGPWPGLGRAAVLLGQWSMTLRADMGSWTTAGWAGALGVQAGKGRLAVISAGTWAFQTY